MKARSGGAVEAPRFARSFPVLWRDQNIGMMSLARATTYPGYSDKQQTISMVQSFHVHVCDGDEKQLVGAELLD